ncbi:hypothetical protein HY008_01765, partial [Candidatus Woesebacteria bacterium]|nr:hypothetical protein [Candidatus Woesebacteria bacterium]
MNQKGFAPLIIIIIATLVISAGVGGFLVLREKKIPFSEKIEDVANPIEPTPSPVSPPAVQVQTPPTPPASKPSVANEQKRGSISSANCQPNDHPVFTASFTDIDKLARISPMGGIMVGSQSRTYVGMKKDENGLLVSSPVYAPVDSKLVAIVYAWRGDKTDGVAEYRLDFQVSCEVTYSFDHIPQLSDKLSKLAPKIPADNTYSIPNMSVPIKAGEQVGSTQGLDFFLFNRAKKVEHINPKRWLSEHNTAADCPYDYFTNELKNKYYSLFTSGGGLVPNIKTCRSASRDVVGTLAGAWFQGDATDRQGAHLYIADDVDRVDMVRMLQNRDYDGSHPDDSLRDANPSKNPDQVKVGESVCYSDNRRFAYFQVIDINTMKASIASGTCPSVEPNSGY